jgi:hypothetical protein
MLVRNAHVVVDNDLQATSVAFDAPPNDLWR